ncbi:hypothetical protein GCM10027181_32920 [Rheinheimera gaetbuli]
MYFSLDRASALDEQNSTTTIKKEEMQYQYNLIVSREISPLYSDIFSSPTPK